MYEWLLVYLLFCTVADDAELDLLAKLVEQEVEEKETSTVTDSLVAVVKSGHAEPCDATSTESTESNVDDGCCSVNSESVANTEASVTETDEQCQYFW